MPAAIWAAPMARVRCGRLASERISLRQGRGPRFQALASAVGRMRAMTPSPMRTMAAKCFARVGLVINMWSKRLWVGCGVVCGVGCEVRRRRFTSGMTAKMCDAVVRVESGDGVCAG